MNDRTQSNQPTFVFKTSLVSLEIAEKMTRAKTIILVMHLFILMETTNEPKESLSLHCDCIIHY